MKYTITGFSGGIGSAIVASLAPELPTAGVQDIDWLICAHGFIGEENIEETFTANVMSCIKYTETFLPTLKQGVIYISSTAALGGNSKYPVYSASKAALNIYAKSMQKAHPALQFYALCPGPTNTKMWQSLGLSGTPQEPVEVAKAVQRIMAGEFKGHVVITVRNGKVVWV